MTRRMKKTLMAFVLAATGLVSAHAQAETVQIDSMSRSYVFAGSQYRFDAASGTAWIHLNYVEPRPNMGRCGPMTGGGYSGPGAGYGGPDLGRVLCREPVTRHHDELASVRGLSFDRASSQIVYRGATGKYVCAAVVEKSKRWPRRGKYWLINPTGECRVFAERGPRGTTVYFEAK